MKREISKSVIICAVTLCVAAIAVSGYKVVTILKAYRAAYDEYAHLRDLAGSDLPGAQATPQAPGSGPTPQPTASSCAVTTAPSPHQAEGAEARAASSAAQFPLPQEAIASAIPDPARPVASPKATATAASAAVSQSPIASPTPTAAQKAASQSPIENAASTAAQTSPATQRRHATVVPAASQTSVPAQPPTATAAQSATPPAIPPATRPAASPQPTGAFLPAAATPPIASPQSEGAAQNTALPTPEPLIQLDFAPLAAINPDVAAWIVCANTVIDYPVVLGKNNEYYLHHLFSGEWGFSGTIFMDADNRGDFSDQITVLYGHHMNNGTMFAALPQFRDQEFLDLHPTMELYTPGGDYVVELFAAFARDASAIPHDFDTPEAFLAYVAELRALSAVASDVEIGPDDRLLMLSTCSYVYDDARFVLVGRLVPLYK